jgi:acyl-CoA dehydrogenase
MEIFLSSEDLAFQERCQQYARSELAPLAKRLGEIDEVPADLRISLSGAGIFGPLFPQEYGGEGVSAVRICLAREVLAGVYGPADVTLAMQGLGGYPIVLAGSPEQKQQYLPELASGKKLTTFCLTEPNAGSDVASIETTAVSKDNRFLINGRKRFISNGYSADMAVLFAKTPTKNKPQAISAFMVERDTPGWELTWRIPLMASHDIVEFQFKDVSVAQDALLGPHGGGFRLALGTLDLMRMSVGAAAVGMAQTAQQEAMRYARNRIQFGRPISRFQATAFKVAEMVTEIEASRCLVYLAAFMKDQGDPKASVHSSMAKLYATEAAFRCIDQAVQIQGGVGLVRGSTVERLYREIRPLRIYEGTSEIQRLIIANHFLKEARRNGSATDQKADSSG